jgi:cytochrome P450
MSTRDAIALDPDRIRELFDLRSSHNQWTGGSYHDDPYPAWHRLRETGPVHEGIVHELTGYDQPAFFQGLPFPERPHYSAFSFAACDEAFRDAETFASSPEPLEGIDKTQAIGPDSSMLCMNGKEHRRYRTLVQPSFVPGRAKWWMERWINATVHALIDGFVDTGHADLNTDFCAAIPMLTITGSFGIPVADALDLRASLRIDNLNGPDEMVRIVAPVVAARREQAVDDLISVLVEAEITDEDGVSHRLSDAEIYSFSYLLLAAGSGTTWKQMGITLAALLTRPELLDAVRDDRTLLRAAIEESTRWAPTDPMFSRFVRRDIEFHGVQIPEGAVMHLCLGAANRDPARYERPDEYDPSRPPQPSLAFGGGPHVCLGMHVARAEMAVGIGALLDRLPNLRLDPDAEPPQIIGMYERGATEIQVKWD